jgi:hypothetical protein
MTWLVCFMPFGRIRCLKMAFSGAAWGATRPALGAKELADDDEFQSAIFDRFLLLSPGSGSWHDIAKPLNRSSVANYRLVISGDKASKGQRLAPRGPREQSRLHLVGVSGLLA